MPVGPRIPASGARRLRPILGPRGPAHVTVRVVPVEDDGTTVIGTPPLSRLQLLDPRCFLAGAPAEAALAVPGEDVVATPPARPVPRQHGAP